MEMRLARCLFATGKLQASALAGVKPDSSALHCASRCYAHRNVVRQSEAWRALVSEI
jgi:hypothetical protein